MWFKMSIPVFDRAPPRGFFDSARDQLLGTYKIAKAPPHTLGPRVTYIDRQDTSRRMSDEMHERFLEVLLGMQQRREIELRHLRLEEYSPTKQVGYIARTDVSRHEGYSN